MLSRNEVSQCPKDDHAMRENLLTQPMSRKDVFNRSDILTVGWYPICESSKIPKKKSKSFNILTQRITLFRSETGKVFAVDSFCPHLGADLGNGLVSGEKLRCLYHKWEFNGEGELTDIPCSKKTPKDLEASLNAYQVEEKYGFIWVFSGDKDDIYPVPNPPGIEGEISSVYVRKVELKTHHHVLMSNAIDLLHFKTLHKLDVEFEYEAIDEGKGVFSWDINGSLKGGKLIIKIYRLFFSDRFKFRVLFAGGTMTGIRVETPPMLGIKALTFPSINVMWGAMPTLKGVGIIYNFLVVKKYHGFFSWVKNSWAYLITFLVLTLLRDDDIFVYPHMRFSVGKLLPEDQSLAKFISLFNSLKISSWTNKKDVS